MSVMAETALDGAAVNADATVSMVMQGLPQFGEMSFDMEFGLAGADAELLGRVQRTLEGAGVSQDPMAAYATAESDLLALFAAGFEMNFEQFNMTLPQGTVTSKMLFSFKEKDPAGFAWTSLLMTTEAAIDLSIPEPLVEMLLQVQPGSGHGDRWWLPCEERRCLRTCGRNEKGPAHHQRRTHSHPVRGRALGVGVMACDPRTLDVTQSRGFRATAGIRLRATRMKHAAGRRVDRRRHLTAQRSALWHGHRVWHRH